MDSPRLVNPFPVRPAPHAVSGVLPRVPSLPSISLPTLSPSSTDLETLKMMNYHVQNLQSLMGGCFLEGKIASYNAYFLQYHVAGLSSLLEVHKVVTSSATLLPPSSAPAPARDPLLFVRETPQFKRVRVNKLRGPCKHCGLKESPEWRKGPSGEKTLCNACGIHFQKWSALPKLVPTAPPAPSALPTAVAPTHDVEVIND